MDMQNILNKLTALTTESLALAGGSHAPNELDEYLELDEVTALGDRNPGRVEPDDLSLRDDKHLKKIVIPSSKCLELVAKDFEGDEGHTWHEFEKIMQREVPGWKAAGWKWDVEVNDSNITVYTQEKKYSGDDDDLLYEADADLARMKQMKECWEPMAAPQASDMNVTTNLDSKTGNKTVTVTADGAGAEDLMKILTMAGIAVAPAPVVAVGEQLANEPAPATLDAQTQLVDLSGGPNAPHGQYNPDRGRDNSMTMMDEAVNQLAIKLKTKFQNQ